MIYMSYTEKFQNKANAARVRVGEVQPNEVDVLMETGVILLD
ncbi:MAG TPA: sulfurtransferase, partial [Gammaproteobacteria bacterium]|nr:sulfurtransferase [Gammaproteobacteria bacterium]